MHHWIIFLLIEVVWVKPVRFTLLMMNSLMLSDSRFFENAVFQQKVDTIPVQKCFDNEGEEPRRILS